MGDASTHPRRSWRWPSADVAAAGQAGDAVSDLLDAEIDSLTIAYVAKLSRLSIF